MIGRIKNVALRRLVIVATFPLVMVFAIGYGSYLKIAEAVSEAVECWNRD